MPLAEGLIPGVHKIAVLRANGIGDLMFALPALEALRAAYPEAEIVLLGRSWHAAFMNGRPGPIDRAIAVPPSRGVNGNEGQADDLPALQSFYARMREERFDLAVQMHGGGRYSNPFVRRLGARIAIGLRSPDAAPLDRNLPYVYLQPEIMRYLELVALAGTTATTFEPRLTLCAPDVKEAATILPDDGRRIALLHPGATDPRRHWPVDKYAEVGRRLAGAGARLLINGTPEEEVLCAHLCDAVPAAENLCGRLSLGGLAGLLARCAVVVSNDTGPLHVAHALGVPTVGIYWCLNLLNGGPLTRRRHRPFVSFRTRCPVCEVDCLAGGCAHDASFVADIDTEAVCEAALALYRDDALVYSVSTGGHAAFNTPQRL